MAGADGTYSHIISDLTSSSTHFSSQQSSSFGVNDSGQCLLRFSTPGKQSSSSPNGSLLFAPKPLRSKKHMRTISDVLEDSSRRSGPVSGKSTLSSRASGVSYKQYRHSLSSNRIPRRLSHRSTTIQSCTSGLGRQHSSICGPALAEILHTLAVESAAESAEVKVTLPPQTNGGSQPMSYDLIWELMNDGKRKSDKAPRRHRRPQVSFYPAIPSSKEGDSNNCSGDEESQKNRHDTPGLSPHPPSMKAGKVDCGTKSESYSVARMPSRRAILNQDEVSTSYMVRIDDKIKSPELKRPPSIINSGLQFVSIAFILCPITLAGFESSRHYPLELYLEAVDMSDWDTRQHLSTILVISQVSFTVGQLLSPISIWIGHKRFYKLTNLRFAIALFVVACSVQFVSHDLTAITVSRTILGIANAHLTWVMVAFVYESFIISTMPLCGTVMTALWALGSVLAKVTELGRFSQHTHAIFLKPLYLQNIVLMGIAMVTLGVTFWFAQPCSVLDLVREDKDEEALAFLLGLNASITRDVGKRHIKEAANSATVPSSSLLHSLKRSKSFRREFILLLFHLSWINVGLSFIFTGGGQEMLQSTSTTTMSMQGWFSKTQLIIPILSNLIALASYIPSYLVIKSLNRSVLLIGTIIIEAILLTVCAICINCWSLSPCVIQGTSGSGTKWLAIVCALAFYQVLLCLTLPGAWCYIWQSLRIQEAPVALMCGVASSTLLSTAFLATSHAHAGSQAAPAILCGASANTLGIAGLAFITALAVFFFGEVRSITRWYNVSDQEAPSHHSESCIV
eukprot:Protomagalhaensia_sp_Gyna_25__5628@NODE_786_length_2623_cov_12_635062_g617_i0_p1_GENE_NODE_786_length_2623_cov_12_635062_g617_i0NODE_786_length_2623_cov_12_635062_g617_i0_p1_ORF_typecomplete_len795_score67_48Sugar_tr/PF00083_24/2_3e13Doppel/PF11466_8/1_8e03Doppel/PF11466_8/0_77MFS_1/PF07690_16/57_NODE_786_length_2623_cov_12_635062_g617_i0682452